MRLNRILATGLVAVVALTACSPDPLEQYFEDIRDITGTMRRDSVAALPNPDQPTPEGVAGVTDARRSALADLEATVPPPEVRPEHTALVIALADLVDGGEAILAATTGLDSSAFATALESATGLNDIARRVAAGCNALELRANQLGYQIYLGC